MRNTYTISLVILAAAIVAAAISPALYVLAALALAFLAIAAATCMAVGAMFNGSILDYIVFSEVAKGGIEVLGWILVGMAKTAAAAAGSSD